MTTLQHDELPASSSESYRLAIDLRDTDMSYLIYHPGESTGYIYRHFRLTGTDPVKELEQEIYDHPELLQNYQAVRIFLPASQFLFIPDEFRVPDEKVYFDFCFPENRKEVFDEALPESGCHLLFGDLPQRVYFLQRTFPQAQLGHRLASLCEHFRKSAQKTESATLTACISHNEMDLFCYNRQGLVLANTYRFQQPNDAAFYLLTVWQQTGMDQRSDRLELWGEQETTAPVENIMREYIAQIYRPTEIAYPGASGTNAGDCPIHLSILM